MGLAAFARGFIERTNEIIETRQQNAQEYYDEIEQLGEQKRATINRTNALVDGYNNLISQLRALGADDNQINRAADSGPDGLEQMYTTLTKARQDYGQDFNKDLIDMMYPPDEDYIPTGLNMRERLGLPTSVMGDYTAAPGEGMFDFNYMGQARQALDQKMIPGTNFTYYDAQMFPDQVSYTPLAQGVTSIAMTPSMFKRSNVTNEQRTILSLLRDAEGQALDAFNAAKEAADTQKSRDLQSDDLATRDSAVATHNKAMDAALQALQSAPKDILFTYLDAKAAEMPNYLEAMENALLTIPSMRDAVQSRYYSEQQGATTQSNVDLTGPTFVATDASGNTQVLVEQSDGTFVDQSNPSAIFTADELGNAYNLGFEFTNPDGTPYEAEWLERMGTTPTNSDPLSTPMDDMAPVTMDEQAATEFSGTYEELQRKLSSVQDALESQQNALVQMTSAERLRDVDDSRSNVASAFGDISLDIQQTQYFIDQLQEEQESIMDQLDLLTANAIPSATLPIGETEVAAVPPVEIPEYDEDPAIIEMRNENFSNLLDDSLANVLNMLGVNPNYNKSLLPGTFTEEEIEETLYNYLVATQGDPNSEQGGANWDRLPDLEDMVTMLRAHELPRLSNYDRDRDLLN